MIPRYRSICVYAGSADRLRSEYLSAAYQLGRLLAQHGIRLVYGAGKTGMMGAVAEGVLESGGEVTGVVPVNLNLPHLIHAGLTQLEVTDDIQQRKARMSELAEAFIALPGGYGTLDELFETLTWAQLSLHSKPVGLLNTLGYFDPTLEMVRHALREGFIYPEHERLLISAAEPADLLARLEAYIPPNDLSRWVTR
jgi:uncharacterized protein (TIGR00730 family)